MFVPNKYVEAAAQMYYCYTDATQFGSPFTKTRKSSIVVAYFCKKCMESIFAPNKYVEAVAQMYYCDTDAIRFGGPLTKPQNPKSFLCISINKHKEHFCYTQICAGN